MWETDPELEQRGPAPRDQPRPEASPRTLASGHRLHPGGQDWPALPRGLESRAHTGPEPRLSPPFAFGLLLGSSDPRRRGQHGTLFPKVPLF